MSRPGHMPYCRASLPRYLRSMVPHFRVNANRSSDHAHSAAQPFVHPGIRAFAYFPLMATTSYCIRVQNLQTHHWCDTTAELVAD